MLNGITTTLQGYATKASQYHGVAIPSVFGNGLLGHAVTGLLRIPAYMTAVAAAQMVGELAIRGLSATLAQVGLKVKKDNWIEKLGNRVEHWGVRPYAIIEERTGAHKYSSRELAIKAAKLVGLTILSVEFVRLLGGTAPAVYNNVLTFMGPLRFDSRSYPESVGALLRSYNVIA